MGYTLRIGNAEVVFEDEESGLEIGIRLVIDAASPGHEDVPTKFTNERRPSYSGWSIFCKETNLTDLFYNKDTGLIRDHPGVVLLTQAHLNKINAAYENCFKSKAQQVYNLPRLEWLRYWVDWALKNCKFPAITNS